MATIVWNPNGLPYREMPVDKAIRECLEDAFDDYMGGCIDYSEEDMKNAEDLYNLYMEQGAHELHCYNLKVSR